MWWVHRGDRRAPGDPEAVAELRTVVQQHRAEPPETTADPGVGLQASQTTVEPVDDDGDDLSGGVTAGVGAATALQHVADADVQLPV